MSIVTKRGNKMTDYPEMNTMLMEQVMTFIKDHPEQHDQAGWVDLKYNPNTEEPCGTTCCFAGHAMLMSGEYKIIKDEIGEPVLVKKSLDRETINYFSDADIRVDPEEAGATVLGLTDEEADHLFYSGTGVGHPPLEEAYKVIMNGEFRKP